MKTIVLFLVLFPTASTLAGQGALRIDFVEGNVSIEADRVDLGSLLGELDATAGTSSTVPPELADQRVSARLSGLPVDQAIRKLFGGLSLDYAVVGAERIVVLARSRSVTPTPIVRSQPADAPQGIFELPGFRSQDSAAPNRTGGLGGTGLLPLPRTGAVGTTPDQTLPGLGTTLPFGRVPTPATGSTVDQVSPGLIGNTSPAILDLNQQQTSGARPAVGQPAPPVPASSPSP